MTSYYIEHLILFSYIVKVLNTLLFILFVSFVNHQCLKGARESVPINRAPSQANESTIEMFPGFYFLCPCDSLKILSEKSDWKSCLIRGDFIYQFFLNQFFKKILMAVEAVSVKGSSWLQMGNYQVITQSTPSLPMKDGSFYKMGSFFILILKVNIL